MKFRISEIYLFLISVFYLLIGVSAAFPSIPFLGFLGALGVLGGAIPTRFAPFFNPNINNPPIVLGWMAIILSITTIIFLTTNTKEKAGRTSLIFWSVLVLFSILIAVDNFFRITHQGPVLGVMQAIHPFLLALAVYAFHADVITKTVQN